MRQIQQQEEKPGLLVFSECLIFPLQRFWWYFEDTNVKSLAGNLFAKFFSLDSNIQIQIISSQVYPLFYRALYRGEKIVCIVTTIKFPVVFVNFWIDVTRIFGLHMSIGTSLRLQKLMYFQQVRLALSEPQISISYHICSCGRSFLFYEIRIYIFINALVYDISIPLVIS